MVEKLERQKVMNNYDYEVLREPVKETREHEVMGIWEFIWRSDQKLCKLYEGNGLL